MRTYLFALAVFTLTITQSASAQSLKFGIKAGADINKMKGKAFTNEYVYGYQVGVFSEIGIAKGFGLQPEILLSQVAVDTASGFKDLYQFSNWSTQKFKYAKIPLLLFYKPNEFVSLQLGPQFGMLIDKNKNITENGKTIFKEGDVSILSGLQLNISKIRLYGRYGFGLNNLNETGSDDKWKNRNVQLGVGLTL